MGPELDKAPWHPVMLDMLKNTPMLDFHDDNGPGRIECPVCGASVSMRWKWGKRLDSPEEIKHRIYCPVAWAKAQSD
jgi:hypothetical protein